MSRNIDYKSDCCNAAVGWDAYAHWNAETQEHELSSTYDDTTCTECGDECGVHVVDAQTGEKLGNLPTAWGEYVPIAESQAAWEVHYEKLSAERVQREAERKQAKIVNANAEALAAAHTA